MDPKTFAKIDFKYVDNQPDGQLLKGLKVWFEFVRIYSYSTCKPHLTEYHFCVH
jgi:hypothetical protein